MDLNYLYGIIQIYMKSAGFSWNRHDLLIFNGIYEISNVYIEFVRFEWNVKISVEPR